MDLRLVYITAKDREEARKIGRALVEERLAACVNIIDDVASIYRWEGKLCEEREALLLLKTTADRVTALTERVKELHSYDCPCILVLPVLEGNEEYLRWIEREIGHERNATNMSC